MYTASQASRFSERILAEKAKDALHKNLRVKEAKIESSSCGGSRRGSRSCSSRRR